MNTYEERDFYHNAAINKAKAVNREAQIECILEDKEFVPISKEDTEEWKEVERCNMQNHWELNILLRPAVQVVPISNYMDWKNKNDSRLLKNQEKYRRKFFRK